MHVAGYHCPCVCYWDRNSRSDSRLTQNGLCSVRRCKADYKDATAEDAHTDKTPDKMVDLLINTVNLDLDLACRLSESSALRNASWWRWLTFFAIWYPLGFLGQVISRIIAAIVGSYALGSNVRSTPCMCPYACAAVLQIKRSPTPLQEYPWRCSIRTLLSMESTRHECAALRKHYDSVNVVWSRAVFLHTISGSGRLTGVISCKLHSTTAHHFWPLGQLCLAGRPSLI